MVDKLETEDQSGDEKKEFTSTTFETMPFRLITDDSIPVTFISVDGENKDRKAREKFWNWDERWIVRDDGGHRAFEFWEPRIHAHTDPRSAGPEFRLYLSGRMFSAQTRIWFSPHYTSYIGLDFSLTDMPGREPLIEFKGTFQNGARRSCPNEMRVLDYEEREDEPTIFDRVKYVTATITTNVRLGRCSS